MEDHNISGHGGPYTRRARCKRCGNSFTWPSQYAKGRPRSYCDNCDSTIKNELAAARMRKMRKARGSSSGSRRQAKKPTDETTSRASSPEFESFRARVLDPLHARAAMTL